MVVQLNRATRRARTWFRLRPERRLPEQALLVVEDHLGFARRGVLRTDRLDCRPRRGMFVYRHAASIVVLGARASTLPAYLSSHWFRSYDDAPQPPPPGVATLMTSPAATRSVTFTGSRCARRSSPCGKSQFSPGIPGWPPDKPHGRDTRRSVTSETVQSSSTSISRMIPSPPGANPSPPLPRRIEHLRTRKG